MGMRSYPRFRQTFRGGAALECRFESCDNRTVHTSTRRTEEIVAGIHRGVGGGGGGGPRAAILAH